MIAWGGGGFVRTNRTPLCYGPVGLFAFITAVWTPVFLAIINIIKDTLKSLWRRRWWWWWWWLPSTFLQFLDPPLVVVVVGLVVVVVVVCKCISQCLWCANRPFARQKEEFIAIITSYTQDKCNRSTPVLLTYVFTSELVVEGERWERSENRAELRSTL